MQVLAALDRTLDNTRLHADNLREFRRINAECVGRCNHATTQAFAYTNDPYIRNLQKFAVEIGVDLPITGKLDAWTMRFARTFQQGMILGDYRETPLGVDGLPGPATSAAVDYSRNHGHRCAPNFRWANFVTKNNDRTPSANNPVLMLHRDLIVGLQDMRTYYEVPLYVNSGFRDSFWNSFVGGSRASQHLLGKAADFHLGGKIASVDVCRRWFTGLGVHRVSGRVSHVDVRDTPTQWWYSGS